FRTFVETRILESQLARMLNDRGIRTDLGAFWTYGTVHQVLTSEKYAGNNVYNRISYKLKQTRVVNPQEKWIRANAAFEPVVSLELFARTQEIIRERSQRRSNDELLIQLRDLLEREG